MTTNTLGTLWLFKQQFGFKQNPLDIAYEVYFKALLICANGDGRLTKALFIYRS